MVMVILRCMGELLSTLIRFTRVRVRALFEFIGFGFELFVREVREFCELQIDGIHNRLHFFGIAAVLGAEYFGYQFEHILFHQRNMRFLCCRTPSCDSTFYYPRKVSGEGAQHHF